MSKNEVMFDQILRYTKLLHEYRTIERKILKHGTEERENDVEHSFNLAMLAWYINATAQAGLDTEKLLSYALAHDLVEVYAGDTPFYDTASQAANTKHEREAAAAARLKQEFPEFEELHAAIAAYEARADRESLFIYALDKVEPVLGIYLDRGRTWRADGVTLQMLKDYKTDKVALDPTINELFQTFLARVTAEHDALFERPQ